MAKALFIIFPKGGDHGLGMGWKWAGRPTILLYEFTRCAVRRLLRFSQELYHIHSERFLSR
jgi:hypothetical protein